MLPPQHRALNFLEPIRNNLCNYLQMNSSIKLHELFHHLDSSQALTFNLFYPYFTAGGEAARALSTSLGINDDVVDWKFENVPDIVEGTNVDIVWSLPNGGTVFCEVKLSKTAYSRAENDIRHRKKLEQIYGPCLESLASDESLTDNLRDYALALPKKYVI